MTTINIVILLVLFTFISTIFSMIGMGGGILYLPILILFGLPIKKATTTSLILILVTSLTATAHFFKNKKIDFKLALLIDPITDIMAFCGGYFAGIVSEKLLLSILTIILYIAGLLMIKKPNLKERKNSLKHKSSFYWHRKFNEYEYSVNIPLVIAVSGGIGIIAGMLGITGGIIKLPLMVIACNVPIDIAIATSTVMVSATALFGLAGHILNEQVNFTLGFILSLSAIIGGTIGSKISLKTNKAKLKSLFGIIVLLIAIKFSLKLITF